MLLSPSQIREHIETDLPNQALQRLADAAERRIDSIAGEVGSIDEHFDLLEPGHTFPVLASHGHSIYLSRRFASIDNIEERGSLGDTPITLNIDDYETRSERVLLRRADGTNPRGAWAPHVKVTYTPFAMDALRKSVQVELIRLAVSEIGGPGSVDQGDFSFDHGNIKQRVDEILRPLASSANRMPIA